MPLTEIIRTHSISRQTYFLWRSKVGGALVKDLERLKKVKQ